MSICWSGADNPGNISAAIALIASIGIVKDGEAIGIGSERGNL